MADVPTSNKSVDLSAIQDPIIRRVLREYHEQVMGIINRQQMQIEAMLEAMIDKNLTSIGEFKRQIQKRLSQSAASSSSNRLHDAMLSAVAAASPAKPPSP